jgi:hypothetical protein
MAELSREWVTWSLVNGIPAAFATLLFLIYPPFGKNFAWNVEHRQSSIFLGTGFLLRAGLFVHIITARYWGEISWMTWGNAVFAGVLLGVTMIWGERFVWRRLIAIIWLFLYIEEPVWMLSLVPAARAAAAAAGPLPVEPIHPFLQGVLLLEAIVMLVAGLHLFFMDRFARPLWPWTPDPISRRILAGWPLAWAAWAPTLAFSGTWLAVRGGVALNLVWLGAVFLSLFLFRRQFDLSGRPARLVAGVTALFFVLLLAGYFIQM